MKLLASNRRILTGYFLVTAALIAFNVIQGIHKNELQTQHQSVSNKIEQFKQQIESDRAAAMEYRRLQTSRESYDRYLLDLLRSQELLVVEPSLLLDEQTTFFCVPDKTSAFTNILTSSTEELKVIYEVSHRHLKTKPNTIFQNDPSQIIETYRFEFPLQSNTWNTFGFDVDRDDDSEIPVVVEVDGNVEKFGEMPNFETHDWNRIFVPIRGKIELDQDGNYYVAKPHSIVLVDSPNADSKEILRIDVTVTSAKN